MTYKEKVTVNFQAYEYHILENAYQLACENIENDMPEELYTLLNELQEVTNKLMAMDEEYGR